MVGKKMEIVWDRRALASFDSIVIFINEKFGNSSKEKFITKTNEFIEVLMNFPEIGGLENKEYQIRAFVLSRQITVYYRIITNTVFLLNFFDNRQNPKKKKY